MDILCKLFTSLHINFVKVFNSLQTLQIISGFHHTGLCQVGDLDKIAKVSAWNTVACAKTEKDNLLSGLNPHTPAPALPAILDPSICKISPMDFNVIGQVSKHFKGKTQ
jgi:hypothetical protein